MMMSLVVDIYRVQRRGCLRVMPHHSHAVHGWRDMWHLERGVVSQQYLQLQLAMPDFDTPGPLPYRIPWEAIPYEILRILAIRHIELRLYMSVDTLGE